MNTVRATMLKINEGNVLTSAPQKVLKPIAALTPRCTWHVTALQTGTSRQGVVTYDINIFKTAATLQWARFR